MLSHESRQPASWLIFDVRQKTATSNITYDPRRIIVRQRDRRAWAKTNMKTRLAILFFTALGLKAEIEFSGFFATSKEAFFSLTDTDSKRSSGWLTIGQVFEGHAVVSFDHEREIITLKKGEHMLVIPIRSAKVKAGRATITGSLKFLNEKVEGVRASLFFGEEASFPLKNGVIFRIKPQPFHDGNIVYHAKFISIDKNGAEQVLAAPSVVAIPGKPFGIQVGEFGYSFAP